MQESLPLIEQPEDVEIINRHPNCSRSLKINELEGLANLSPCAKYEGCRSNGSQDITYKRRPRVLILEAFMFAKC